jgi:hypothetical protein
MKPRIKDIVKEINSKLGFLGWPLLKYKPRKKRQVSSRKQQA